MKAKMRKEDTGDCQFRLITVIGIKRLTLEGE